MLDPSPDVIAKTVQSIGAGGWVGNILGALVLIACGLAWWRGEPRKNEAPDLSALLLKHDALKSITEIEGLLQRAVKLLSDIDRGQKYSHKWFEALWNDQEMITPAKKKLRKRPPPDEG
jgi:hypothetical protein